MIDFNNLISKYLRRELKTKTIGRYYPSEAGACVRKAWYSYKFPKETEEELIKIFEVGNMFHDFIVDVLKSEKNPEVELLKEEMPFQVEVDDFIVSGRIDDLVLITMSGKSVLVEVKSTKSIAYTKKPNKSHEMQLQIYMHFTGVHNGMVLYLEKNTLQSKAFTVDYDKAVAEKAMERFRHLHNFLKEDKLPEPEAKLKADERWMCSYCNYKQECDANKA